MAKHKLSKKGAITIILVAVFLVLLFLAYLAMDALLVFNYAALYSDKQHLRRVERRVQKFYMTDEYDYTGFKVYPLYDENDEMQYMLVEFEPAGFLYIKISERSNVIIAYRGMYVIDPGDDYPQKPWRRYRYTNNPAIKQPDGTWTEDIHYIDSQWKFDSNINGGYLEPYIRWETDENGEFTSYNKSPYDVAGVKDEKLYLIKSSYDNYAKYVPAVKRGEKWLNLVSMQEFTVGDYSSIYLYDEMCDEWLIPCAHIDLFWKYHSGWN